MTVQTKNNIYSLSGKQAPYKVMKFDLSGVYLSTVGELNKANKEALLEFAEKHELFLSEAKGSLSVAKVAKKPRKPRKKK